MAKRPPLSDESFLAHLFSPKKNPLPTGLRARPLVATKGRVKGRVAAYNRMSPMSQEVLRRSGLRDAYLKGERKLSEAKSALRIDAVQRGIARPLRGAKAPLSRQERKRLFIGEAMRTAVTRHVTTQLVREDKPVNVDTVYRNTALYDDTLAQAVLRMRGGQIIQQASTDDNTITLPDGASFNPFWYH